MCRITGWFCAALAPHAVGNSHICIYREEGEEYSLFRILQKTDRAEFRHFRPWLSSPAQTTHGGRFEIERKRRPFCSLPGYSGEREKICKIYVFSFLASFPVPYIGRRSHHSRIFVERRFPPPPPPPPPPPNPRKTLVGAFLSLLRVERERERPAAAERV